MNSLFFNPKYQSAIILTFVMLAAGYLLRKRNTVSRDGKNAITSFLWSVCLPCLAFSSFMQDFSPEDIKKGISVLIASLVFYILFALAGYLIFKRLGRDKAIVSAFMVSLGQLTLFSMPILNAVGLSRAVFYSGIMTLSFRGVLYMGANPLIMHSKNKSLKTVVLNPVMLAMLAGFAIFVTQGFLPKINGNALLRFDLTAPPLYGVIKTVADLVCPLAMLLIGLNLGDASLKSTLKNKTVWLVALLRVAVAPLVVYLTVRALPMLFDNDAVLALTFSFAAPASVTVCAFCTKANRETEFSSEISALTAFLCVVTLPLWGLAFSI